MFLDPAIDGTSAWYGYGSMKLLLDINYSIACRNPKILLIQRMNGATKALETGLHLQSHAQPTWE